MGLLCSKKAFKIPEKVEALKSGEVTLFADGKYVHNGDKPALLHMKSKFWTLEDEFPILDKANNDTPVFVFKGKRHTLKEKRTMYDSDGNAVFVIKEPKMTSDRQYIYLVNEDGSAGEELFSVGSNFGNTKQSTKGLKNKDGKEIQISGRTTFATMKGVLVVGDDINTGVPIAKIRDPKELVGTSSTFGAMTREDYLLEIAPGVDLAVVLAIALAYEQMENNYFYY